MRFPVRLGFVCVILFAFSSAQVPQPAIPPPPASPKHPVANTYHGVKVVDDYRLLENWDDPQVKQWSALENRRTREYLDRLPYRAQIRQRLGRLISGGSSRYFDLDYRGGVLFAMKDEPPKQQPMLVVMLSAA